MFDFFRRQKTNKPEPNNPEEEASVGHGTVYETWVYWPNREPERLTVDGTRLDAKSLTGARNWLNVLSLNGSLIRASSATRRSQTLIAVPSLTGPPLAVRITGESDRPLGTVAVFGPSHDTPTVKAGLKIVASEANLALSDLEAIVSKSKTPNGMFIVNHGAKDDAAIDEAYGMALYLGAAMNESSGAADQKSEQAPAPPPLKSGLPISEVTLEQLAILHQRSALILCGLASGSRDQAQAWDDWLERYRLPSQADGMNLVNQAGAENVISVNLIVAQAFWGEMRTMPYRFVALHGTAASYAIPWDGDNVPDITEFAVDPSKPAVANVAGKVERLAS